MATTYQYIVEVTAKNQQFLSKFNSANKVVGKMDTKVKTAQKSVQSTTMSLGGMASAMGLAFGVQQVTAFIGKMDELYRVQAAAEAKVAQAIESTGKAAQLSLSDLKREASDLQKKTIFGDENILNNATAQLLTFTNIAGDNFMRTQQIALDLATVLDSDLKSASIQLGKALNDPVKNLSALSRSGIQFSNEQIAVIKTLAETNRLAEAQTLILDELTRQYGGQAEAAALVDGNTHRLANSWGDLLETVGGLTKEENTGVKGFLADMVELARIKLTFDFGGKEDLEGLIDTLPESDAVKERANALKDKTKEALKSILETAKKDSARYNQLWQEARDSDNIESEIYWSKQRGMANSYLEDIKNELNKRQAITAIEVVQPRSIDVVNAKIKQLTAEVNSAQTALQRTSDYDSFLEEKKSLDKLKKQLEDAKIAYTELAGHGQIRVIGTMETKGADQLAVPDMELPQQIAIDYSKVANDINEAQQRMIDKQQMLQYAFEDGFSAIGMSVVDGLGLAETGFQGFVSGLLETTVQLISMALAQSIANSVMGATASAAATGPAAIFTQPAFLATMIGGVMSAFAAIPSFNDGGVVPGTSLTGDKVLIRANSGEEVVRRDDPRHRYNQRTGGSSCSNVRVSQSVEFTGRKMRVMLKKEDRFSKYLS